MIEKLGITAAPVEFCTSCGDVRGSNRMTCDAAAHEHRGVHEGQSRRRAFDACGGSVRVGYHCRH
jgi:hypothetical protein